MPRVLVLSVVSFILLECISYTAYYNVVATSVAFPLENQRLKPLLHYTNYRSRNLSQQSSKWNAWMLAIRPRTLPAAAAGVVIGSALAWRDGFFRLDVALTCLLTALLLQIGSNLANDVFDFERGTDTPDRLGPVRVTQAGLLRPSQVKVGMIVVFGLATVLGLYLAWLGGWPIILLGVAAILSAIAYTAR